jgi:hypothetical protein
VTFTVLAGAQPIANRTAKIVHELDIAAIKLDSNVMASWRSVEASRLLVAEFYVKQVEGGGESIF